MDFEVTVSNMFIDDTTTYLVPKGDPKRFMVQKRKTIVGWGNTTYVILRFLHEIISMMTEIP